MPVRFTTPPARITERCLSLAPLIRAIGGVTHTLNEDAVRCERSRSLDRFSLGREDRGGSLRPPAAYHITAIRAPFDEDGSAGLLLGLTQAKSRPKFLQRREWSFDLYGTRHALSVYRVATMKVNSPATPLYVTTQRSAFAGSSEPDPPLPFVPVQCRSAANPINPSASPDTPFQPHLAHARLESHEPTAAPVK